MMGGATEGNGIVTVGRMRVGIACAAAACLAVSGAGSAPAAEGGTCDAGSGPDRIARVDPDGGMLLASGREIRLADIRLPGPDTAPAPAGRPGAASWLATLSGREVEARFLAPPDRWGRTAAGLSVREDATSIDVAELLVAEGLAAVDAGERDILCRPALLELELKARAARLGLWAAPGWIVAAADRAGLEAATGRFVLVQGKVASVGERQARTYVNFGRNFARDLALVVPKRVWREIVAAGGSAAALTGRTVTARGFLELRRGPVMEINTAAMLEWRDAAPTTR